MIYIDAKLTQSRCQHQTGRLQSGGCHGNLPQSADGAIVVDEHHWSRGESWLVLWQSVLPEMGVVFATISSGFIIHVFFS